MCLSIFRNVPNGRDRSAQALTQLLRELAAEKKLLEEVHVAFESLVAQQRQPHLEDAYEVVPRRDLLVQVLEDAKANIHTKLGNLEALADQFAQKGEINAAERAYLRALQVHQSPAFKSSTTHCTLLLKVANFYFENGENIQGEECLEKILRLPGVPNANRDDIQRKLADSMNISSQTINTIFLSRATGHDKLAVPIHTPFPPQHRMMRLDYTPVTPADLDELGRVGSFDIMGSPPLHSAIAAGLPVAIDLIHNCAETELEKRDAFGRTPLFLSLMNFEYAGKALLGRFAKLDPGVRTLRMEDRDFCYRTILVVAILSNCPLPFIELLVENGADVNPLLVPDVNTPLQAAVSSRRPDIVHYLLEHGAKIDDVSSHNDLTVTAFALANGYNDVLQVLQAHSPSTL
jgi:tetratricopeptide (TPR) repeat protein